VFENRVLRRIFGQKKAVVMVGWRKQHNGELHNLYSSLSIIRVTQSRRMRWAGHVTNGVKRNAYRLLVGKLEGRRQEAQDVGGWIILKWIIERQDGVVWTGFIWLKMEISGGFS
jgi:hypothetical protein